MEKKMIRQRASNALGECLGLIIFAFFQSLHPSICHIKGR